jgi:hypothetical protein
MEFECPKCGAPNPQATGHPGETCPTCSVIYAKATAARAQERTRQEQQQRSARTATNSSRPWLDRLVWNATVIGSIIGLVQLGYTLASAETAPQQAAGAGIAIAFAVVPYCLARAVTAGRRTHD